MQTMTETEGIAKRIGLDLPTWILPICRYLELRGYRFCVDFGWQNAREVARQHRERERDQKTQLLRKDQI